MLSYLVLMKGLLPSMGKGGRVVCVASQVTADLPRSPPFPLRSRVVCVASQLAGGLDLSDLQSARRRYNAKDVYSTTKQVTADLPRSPPFSFSRLLRR